MINESTETERHQAEEQKNEKRIEERTHEELEAARKAQIERNNEWIEKMSPVVKYKIQEYIRKQRAKKMQRRKFSLACGLNKKAEPTSSYSRYRRRTKRVTSEAGAGSKKAQVTAGPSYSVARILGEAEPVPIVRPVAIRRKSAPVQKMDMRDLDDLG
ncbi:unnamed protein product [Caenorhabditis sp. 36 PRJEB53466]|nr:unnamed protein product [Caenorhabditis sp. 36 PRJEB53466]